SARGTHRWRRTAPRRPRGHRACDWKTGADRAAAGVPRDRRRGHRTGLCDGAWAPDLRRDQSGGIARSKSSCRGEEGTERPCTLAAAKFVRMKNADETKQMGVRGVLFGRPEILGLIHGGTT